MKNKKAELTDLIKGQGWREEKRRDGEDTIYFLYIEDGSVISVLNRMTGYGNGIRDIETGYRNSENKFWLASGGFDIREYNDLTISEAIEKIKSNANTCVGG